MKRTFLCMLVLVVGPTLFAQGQREFGITLKSGIGEMKRVSDPVKPFLLNNITTSPAFSWGITANGRKQLSDLISIESQIAYNNIVGRETESYTILHINPDLNTTTTELIRGETTRNAHYLSFASFVNFHFIPKTSIGLGFSMNYLMTNNRLSEIYSNGQLSSVIGGGNDLNRLDFGLNPQITYQINERFNLNAQAYIGFMNVRPAENRDLFYAQTQLESGQNFEVKNRQFTLGVNYVLFRDKP